MSRRDSRRGIPHGWGSDPPIGRRGGRLPILPCRDALIRNQVHRPIPRGRVRRRQEFLAPLQPAGQIRFPGGRFQSIQSVYHLMPIDDPCECFPMELVTI